MSDDFSAVCGALVPPLYTLLSLLARPAAQESRQMSKVHSQIVAIVVPVQVYITHHTTHVVSLEGTARPAASQGDLALGNKLTKTITVHYQP